MRFVTDLRALASSVRAPVAALLLASLALQGCAAVVLTAAGVAGGAGVNHTLNGIAYKTFNNSLAELRAGTLRTLEEMDMTVIENSKTEAAGRSRPRQSSARSTSSSSS